MDLLCLNFDKSENVCQVILPGSVKEDARLDDALQLL